MERKTGLIIDALGLAPMKASNARKIAGSTQLEKLVKAGCVVIYEDINPDYARSTGGAKPLCQWVKIGATPYVEPRMGGTRKAEAKGIAAAILKLERAGYTVLPPNAIAQGREHSERPAGAEG